MAWKQKKLCAACTMSIPPAAGRYCAACGRDRFRRDRTCDVCGTPIHQWCYCGRCALTVWLQIRGLVDPRYNDRVFASNVILQNLRQQEAWEEIMRECHADELT